MFKEIKKDLNLLGHQLDLPNGFVFFGSKHFPLAEMREYFSPLDILYVKQVHGNRVVESSDEALEADGHWTQAQNKALLIQTADCLPVMIYSQDQVAAVHAGWRGVKKNIIKEALKFFSSDEKLQIFCGPAISTEKFEVGKDVGASLLSADPLRDSSVLVRHPEPSKVYVNLRKILRHQILETHPRAQLHHLDIDTYTSDDHYSYRRNGANAGRLFSFIVRT